jgi:uncharacterized protein YceH (UPF0502 family)
MATPDYYPLTLNALTAACNQLTSRDPIMSLDERTVVRGLDDLRDKRLVWTVSAAGSRVPKYEHRLGDSLALSPPEQATLCVLLLRGPQTIGEIRARTERLCRIPTLDEAAAVLEALAGREVPLLVRLPVIPGSKEPRYAHLLSGPPVIDERPAEAPAEPARLAVETEDQRIAELERNMEELRGEVDTLREELAQFKRQFE